MIDNRRRFIARGGLCVGSLFVLNQGLGARDTSPAGPHSAVVNHFSKLGRCQIVEASESGALTALRKTPRVKVLVRLTKPENLGETLGTMPFERVRASGSTFQFEHAGVNYEVQTLRPKDFDARSPSRAKR